MNAGGILPGGCTLLARGPWPAAAVAATWLPGRWQPPAGAARGIAAAWRARRRPGVDLHDGPMARLASWEAGRGGLRLTLQRTGYRHFIGTNADRARHRGDCADPLGTSCLVACGDGWLALGRRSAAVALHPGMVHPFGGCHEPSDGGDVPGAALRELAEELGVQAAELTGFRVLALVRDPELGQPELLCLAATALAATALAARLDAREHSELVLLRPGQGHPDLTPVAQAALALAGAAAG